MCFPAVSVKDILRNCSAEIKNKTVVQTNCCTTILVCLVTDYKSYFKLLHSYIFQSIPIFHHLSNQDLR